MKSLLNLALFSVYLGFLAAADAPILTQRATNALKIEGKSTIQASVDDRVARIKTWPNQLDQLLAQTSKTCQVSSSCDDACCSTLDTAPVMSRLDDSQLQRLKDLYPSKYCLESRHCYTQTSQASVTGVVVAICLWFVVVALLCCYRPVSWNATEEEVTRWKVKETKRVSEARRKAKVW